MDILKNVDRTVSLSSFEDARQDNDIPAMVSSASGLAATINYKPAALALSIQALGATVTSLAGKVQNNQGVKVSDVMATQAALGTVLGLGAESLGEHIGSRDNKTGKVFGGVGSTVSKAATVYAATALTMSKTNADLAVWNPQNKTGLPKITDLDAGADTLKQTGDTLFDNAKSEFNKSLNDFADMARDMDSGAQKLLDDAGGSILPKLLDLSKTLEKALDSDTWKEKANDLAESIDKAWSDLRNTMEKKLLPKIFDLSDLLDHLTKKIKTGATLTIGKNGKNLSTATANTTLSIRWCSISTATASKPSARKVMPVHCSTTIKTASARQRAGWLPTTAYWLSTAIQTA